MNWFKHERDACIISNLGEMYELVQTWESCMYWFKHGRDVCIGSNMGEMNVLIQTLENVCIGSNCLPSVRTFTF